MVRVYGDGTSLLVDREHEVHVTRLMCEYKLAAKIYCSFDNGILLPLVSSKSTPYIFHCLCLCFYFIFIFIFIFVFIFNIY